MGKRPERVDSQMENNQLAHKKPSIAFVVQRCGQEVNGGAESMCLAIAKELSKIWDIEILTTRALDYMTWDNHYPAGIEVIDKLRIRRFSVDHPRDVADFNKLSDQVLANPRETPPALAEEWMLAQGPISSELSQWIREHVEHYQCFFFFTYLYASSYQNLPLVANKAVLIPNAHDEAPIYLPIFEQFFNQAQVLLCNTKTELNFLQSRFANLKVQAEIVALGIDTEVKGSELRFRHEHTIKEPFVLYLGRIDPSKGCAQLFDFWERFKTLNPSALKLVLAGRAYMPIPERDDIVVLGFISEQTKQDLIASCACLWNPSPFESLSIVLLEAWLQEKKTLVNASCSVLQEQTIRSNGGLWYKSFDEFHRALRYLLQHEWSFDGRKFVEENYSWPCVVQKYKDVLSRIMDNKSVKSECYHAPYRDNRTTVGLQD